METECWWVDDGSVLKTVRPDPWEPAFPQICCYTRWGSHTPKSLKQIEVTKSCNLTFSLCHLHPSYEAAVCRGARDDSG